MTTLMRAAPEPIYWSGDVALNLLPYLPRPIAYGSLEELGAVPGPAWMIMTTADAETLVARHPGKLHIVRPLGESNNGGWCASTRKASVIASEAKQSSPVARPRWFASSRSLSSGRPLRAGPVVPDEDSFFRA